jgi:FkbM family methyltransferase
VEAVSLDEWVIGIDVEGAEASVLDGAASVLDKDKPILLIELHELDRLKITTRPS